MGRDEKQSHYVFPGLVAVNRYAVGATQRPGERGGSTKSALAVILWWLTFYDCVKTLPVCTILENVTKATLQPSLDPSAMASDSAVCLLSASAASCIASRSAPMRALLPFLVEGAVDACVD